MQGISSCFQQNFIFGLIYSCVLLRKVPSDVLCGWSSRLSYSIRVTSDKDFLSLTNNGNVVSPSVSPSVCGRTKATSNYSNSAVEPEVFGSRTRRRGKGWKAGDVAETVETQLLLMVLQLVTLQGPSTPQRDEHGVTLKNTRPISCPEEYLEAPYPSP